MKNEHTVFHIKLPGSIFKREEGKCYQAKQNSHIHIRLLLSAEAYSSVRAFDEVHATHAEEIIILCRKQDIHPDSIVTTDVSGYFGKLEYRDLIFYYQDIYEWIMAQLLRMSPEARIEFYTKLDTYIQQPNIAEKVRIFWKQLHEGTASP